jgi:hypothetical protein
MSIARSVHISGLTGRETPPEIIKVTDDIRAADGCKGMYSVGNAETGEGMNLTLWRDQEAWTGRLT